MISETWRRPHCIPTFHHGQGHVPSLVPCWRQILKLCLCSVPEGERSSSLSTLLTLCSLQRISVPSGLPGRPRSRLGAPAGRQVQLHLSPPSQTSLPKKLLDQVPPAQLSPSLSGPHPLAFPRCRSPEPLCTGRVAGQSVTITAEAGKLPTLNVWPFWPFQVVESGLWEKGW